MNMDSGLRSGDHSFEFFFLCIFPPFNFRPFDRDSLILFPLVS